MAHNMRLVINATTLLTACQIFCIDVTDEMNETMGPSIDGSIEQTLLLTTYVLLFSTTLLVIFIRVDDTSSRLETVQFLVKRYVAMNSMISPQDSYGIILLAEEATWVKKKDNVCSNASEKGSFLLHSTWILQRISG